MLRPASAVFLLAAALSAQPAPRATFEVASVKPSGDCKGPRGLTGSSPGRLTLTCLDVRSLIEAAYAGFSGETLNSRMMKVVGGPAWLDSDHFDIVAKS